MPVEVLVFAQQRRMVSERQLVRARVHGTSSTRVLSSGLVNKLINHLQTL